MAPVISLEHWSLLRVRLLWIFDKELSKTARNHSYFPYPTAAWFIREGELMLRYPTGDETFTAGNWVFPKQMTGQQIFSEGTRLLSVRFFAEWEIGVPLFDRSRTVVIPGEAAPYLEATAVRLERYVRNNLRTSDEEALMLEGDLEHYLDLQPLISEWIRDYYKALSQHGYCAEIMGPMNDTVKRCIHYLQNRRHDRPFHERELAEHIGLSVSQINKLFSKQAKVTPKQFWNYRRLVAAQSAVMGSKESIKVIAFSLGFSSPESFARWFHANAGYSPKVFRTMMQSPA